MGEAENGTCQECGEVKQSAEMALCDACFWQKKPGTVMGPVAQRVLGVKTTPVATKPPGSTGQEPTPVRTCKEHSMDPDVALMKLLEGAEALAEGESTHNEACEIANGFENLHEWLEKGGFPPAKWGDPEAKMLRWLLRELHQHARTGADRKRQEEEAGNEGEALILQGYEETNGALAAQVSDLLTLPVAERPWHKQK